MIKLNIIIFAVLLVGFSPVCIAAGSADEASLKALVNDAKLLEVEDLCVPVKTVRRYIEMLVPDPSSNTYDILQWYYKGYRGPTEVVIVDFGTGEIKKDTIPLNRQIHMCGNVIGPDGKLYIVTPHRNNGMELYVYDPAENSFTNNGIIVPKLGGERRFLVVGVDGMIYGTGSYAKEKKAGAYQLNPWTGKVTDYGPIGPSHAPNGAWGFSIAADQRYVYVLSGMIPWYLVAYDRTTGNEKVILTRDKPGEGIDLRQGRYGCSVRIRPEKTSNVVSQEYWLYKGDLVPKTHAKESPPWFEPAIEKPWVHMPKNTDVFVDKADPMPNGDAEIWYRQRTSGNYKNWKIAKFNVDTYPENIRRLFELPDGRLLGTAGNYQGNFIYDPKTSESTYLGKLSLSHYTTAMYNGKIYMSGYPSSKLFVYDPAKKWTVGKNTPGTPRIVENNSQSNPRLLLRLFEVSRTSKMFDSVVGDNGEVFFGGRWSREGNGGGIAWWNPSRQKADGMWEIFSNYQINYIEPIDNGKYIAISTIAVNDPILHKPTPEDGRIFVFDVNTKQIIHHVTPVRKSKSTGVIASVGNTVIGWTYDPSDLGGSILYNYNAIENVIVYKKKIPYKLNIKLNSNQGENFDFRTGPDGYVWTFIDKILVKITPDDGKINVVGKVKQGGKIGFSGKDIYLGGNKYLRRIKGALGADGI